MDNYEDREYFKNHPYSLAEKRAEMNREARDWTPRDLLICLLREIDNGRVKPTDVVLCYSENGLEGGYMRAGSNPDNHVGALEVAKQRIIEDMFSKTKP